MYRETARFGGFMKGRHMDKNMRLELWNTSNWSWFSALVGRICIPKFGVFVFELKITKGYVFVFDLYLVCSCKYNQIHIKITILPTKGNALPDINWPRSLDRMFFKPVVWSTVGRHSARQHWKNWPTVKLVKHYNIHHVWNAVALCIPSQESWCSITLPLVAFTATYKLPRLPIHSLVLIFDQLDCRPMLSVLPAHSWPYHRCEKHSV